MTDLYLVICYSHRDKSFYIRERDQQDCDRKTTIRDIATGQIEDVHQVLALEPITEPGKSAAYRDVTEDVALEILQQAEIADVIDEDDALTFGHIHDFLEEHLGFERVQRAIAEAVS